MLLKLAAAPMGGASVFGGRDDSFQAGKQRQRQRSEDRQSGRRQHKASSWPAAASLIGRRGEVWVSVWVRAAVSLTGSAGDRDIILTRATAFCSTVEDAMQYQWLPHGKRRARLVAGCHC